MLADPQVLTVNAVAQSCPRISEQNNAARYRKRTTTDELVLDVRHHTGKISGGVVGEGHVVKVTYTVFATASVPETSTTMWMTIQHSDGMDLTVCKNHALALCAYLTGATIDKLFNGES
jgi:hypothetical protein